MRSYLNNCLKIERMVGEVYRRLANVGHYSENLRSIFERMAWDEDAHARQLEIAIGVPEEVFFETALIEPERLEELLKRVHEFLRLSDDPPRSESLMLDAAKDLEREFLQVHLHSAVKFNDAAMMELFQGLAREDQKHLDTLEEYYGGKKPPRHYWH